MTKEELLFVKLIEECAEVQQRASKLLQFGYDESQCTAPTNLRRVDQVPKGTNKERLQEEISDLCSVIELLGFRYPTKDEVLQKLQKIEKYAAYSTKLGKLI